MPDTQSQSNFVASVEDAGKRLDQFLVSQLEDVSRARVQQLIEHGKVQVNSKPEKASYRLHGGEEISLSGPAQAPPLKAAPENIPLDIVYEDESLAVVNKPAGMMVHAGAAPASDDLALAEAGGDSRTRGTLVNALLYRFQKLSKVGGELRPGIVHRLDKDTSGLIVVAKSDSAHRKLAGQFAGREVSKKYLALVHGWPRQATGTVNVPIGRDRVWRNRMSVQGLEGRDAVSHYTVMRELQTPYGKFALVEVAIETGRTHQIRVHMASIGHPVVGDSLYGAPRKIALRDSAQNRAKPKDTKATRDRAATELARQLTEMATDGPPVKGGRKTAAKSTAKRNAEVRSLLVPEISLSRNFLHAATIEFRHPKTGKQMRFSTPLPPELEGFLEQLAHPS